MIDNQFTVDSVDFMINFKIKKNAIIHFKIFYTYQMLQQLLYR